MENLIILGVATLFYLAVRNIGKRRAEAELRESAHES